MRTAFACGLILSLALCAGCGGSSSGRMMQAPAASVVGSWDMVATNLGSAAFTNCTGDLTIFQGLSWGAVISLGDGDTGSDFVPFVSQTGGSWDMAPVTTIDGTRYTGGGTVTGSSLTGRFDCVDPTIPLTVTFRFSGTVQGAVMQLSITTIQAGGGATGQCSVVPGLALSVTIS